MTEREKVIEGLEKVWDAFNHMEHELYADYVYDALELLKEQEPMEPLAEYSVHTGSKWAICGKCHEPLAKASDKEMPNYCPFCGRAVKWDG